MKYIPDFNDKYMADENGNIYSIKFNKKLSQYVIKNGYVKINLCRNGKQTSPLVHRLIALTFIPNPENLKYVNHKNGIKTDNRVVNLEWCTHAQNIHHMRHVLRKGVGFRPNAKIKEAEIPIIRELSKTQSNRSIARKYNVTPSCIDHIVNRIKWKGVP